MIIQECKNKPKKETEKKSMRILMLENKFDKNKPHIKKIELFLYCYYCC